MDLSFSILGRSRRRRIRQIDIGMLIADIVARQAASRTARVQAALAGQALLVPASFNPAVAAILSDRKL